MIIGFPPRRSYSTNCFGERILVGLTAAETREFELLDAEIPVDEVKGTGRIERSAKMNSLSTRLDG